MNKIKRLGVLVLTWSLILYGVVLTMWLVTGNLWARLPLPVLYLIELAIGLVGFMFGMKATYWIKVQPLVQRIQELEDRLNEQAEK